MFERAVICTDLSEESDKLISLAPRLKEIGLRETVLAHVIDIFSDPKGAAFDAAGGVFERQATDLEACGLKVRVDVPVGHVSYSVQDVAKRADADLLVVGGRGLGIFNDAFSGSVASDLVRTTSLPVLLGLDHALADGRAAMWSPFENVLFPTDFSSAADHAYERLRGCVENGAQRLTLLHVQDSARLAIEGAKRVREYDTTDTLRLEKLRLELLDRGAVEVRTAIVHGNPGSEVATRAASGHWSLVVMGSRGRTQTVDRFLGAVSDAVIRKTMCPVLLCPPTAGLPLH